MLVGVYNQSFHPWWGYRGHYRLLSETPAVPVISALRATNAFKEVTTDYSTNNVSPSHRKSASSYNYFLNILYDACFHRSCANIELLVPFLAQETCSQQSPAPHFQYIYLFI